MNDPAILFVKPKAISNADKKVLREAGVIVVTVDDVANVKFARAHAELTGGELLLAAAKGIKSSGVAIDTFGRAVLAAIESSPTLSSAERNAT